MAHPCKMEVAALVPETPPTSNKPHFHGASDDSATPRRSSCSSSTATSSHTTSQTRASSSPPSWPGVQRGSLPPEIYDISAGDGDLCQKSPSPQRSSAMSPDFRSLQLAHALMKVSPERQKALLRELGVGQTDAWNLDDWGGPRRLYKEGTPDADCNRVPTPEVAQCLDETQRAIANAVQAEIQAELDLVVQRVMNPVTTQGHSLQEVVEKLVNQDCSKASLMASLSMQMQELQRAFDEHLRITAKRLEVLEDCGQVAYERAAIPPFPLLTKPTVPSVAVGPPEPKKWCARLDAIEVCLGKQLTHFEAMNAQNSKFCKLISTEYKKLAQETSEHNNGIKVLEHRSVEHDIGLKKVSQALQRLQVDIRDSKVKECQHLRSGSSSPPRLGSVVSTERLPSTPRATSLLEGRRRHGEDADTAAYGWRQQEHTAQLRHAMKATGSSISAERAEKMESYPILSHWERAGDHLSFPVEPSVSCGAI